MKHALLTLVASFVMTGAVAFAHGDAVHHRGVVTQINGKSVTIQTTTKPPKMVTFTVADYTEIDRGTKVAALTDLKVGRSRHRRDTEEQDRGGVDQDRRVGAGKAGCRRCGTQTQGLTRWMWIRGQ